VSSVRNLFKHHQFSDVTLCCNSSSQICLKWRQTSFQNSSKITAGNFYTYTCVLMGTVSANTHTRLGYINLHLDIFVVNVDSIFAVSLWVPTSRIQIKDGFETSWPFHVSIFCCLNQPFIMKLILVEER